MKYAGDRDVRGLLAKQDDMAANLRTPQTRANVRALAPKARIGRQHLAMGSEIEDVPHGLCLPPGSKGVSSYLVQISLGANCEMCSAQLCSRGRAFDFFENAAEYITLSEAAGIAFVDGGSQSGEFRLVDLLLMFEAAKGGADHLAGVLIAPLLDPGGDEAIERWSEVYIACWHGSPVMKDSAIGKNCQRRPEPWNLGLGEAEIDAAGGGEEDLDGRAW